MSAMQSSSAQIQRQYTPKPNFAVMFWRFTMRLGQLFSVVLVLFACQTNHPVEGGSGNTNLNLGAKDDLINLPLEVIGPDGYIEKASFTLSDTNGIDRLYVQCHRCGYRDSSVNSTRGAKGSVRLNAGAWVDLDDKTATVFEPDKSYGGIAGGFHTVRFTVPIAGAITGENKLEFRFNKTDGFTSGYRILKFNLQRAGQNVLSESLFADDSPTLWKAPLTNQTDVQKGQVLWNSESKLRESPLSSRVLRAACSSCHAADGRDLKYFNYSNWSIQERSKFHGLSELEGKQIASYIRGVNAPNPKQARPWNPPYQPGPGLDTKPVEEWAAGAGLNAVLSSDQAMLPYLFTNGTSQTAIDQVSSIKGSLNVRELPVPLQLPDWNEWLPEVHPLDLWGDGFANSEAITKYNTARQAFSSGVEAKIQDKSVISSIESVLSWSWHSTFAYMGGPIPCLLYEKAKTAGTVVRSTLMDQLPPGLTCEDGLQSTNHWLAVKNWELFHTFGLEDDTSKLYPYGEKRGWFGKQRNVFEVASHRSANNSHNFKHHSYALGSYHSNAWYHLQMILNAGNRDPYTWFPQDWFYTPMFIALNSRSHNEPLALLLTAMQIKMFQNLDMTGPDGKGTDRGPTYNGWWLPFVTPWRFESALGWEGPNERWRSVSNSGNPAKGFPWTQLDGYESGLRVKVTNALLKEFLAKQKSYSVQNLKRRSSTVTDTSYFESADYVLPDNAAATPSSCYYPCPGGAEQALPIYRALIRFKEMGVNTNLRGELIDYMKQLFPNPQNNWDALR
jgi:hypothetical protein